MECLDVNDTFSLKTVAGEMHHGSVGVFIIFLQKTVFEGVGLTCVYICHCLHTKQCVRHQTVHDALGIIDLFSPKKFGVSQG